MTEEKRAIFEKVQKNLKENNINYSSYDFDRPWGGFFVVDTTDNSASNFINTYYPEREGEFQNSDLPLSPKILCVAPRQRLSWQYHHRRAEMWKLIDGQAGYIRSDTDEQTDACQMNIDETLILKQGERHRLIGLNDWGIIAEIWQHTDADIPSDEDDIVRLQDDFGR
ncbi:MAG: hypothetical protein WAU01_09870 [Saprospiraceae bacterium]